MITPHSDSYFFNNERQTGFNFKKMKFFLILFYLSEYSFNLRLKRRCIKILQKDINHFILINKECAFNTCIFRKGTFMIPTSSLTKKIIKCSKYF